MSIARILDANMNRASEALRVMEEAARFILDDTALSARFKSARHELREIADGFGPIVLARDVGADVGTDITTEAESRRRDAHDVIRAACRRLTEALRVLEEYGKTIDATHAARIERLRYEAYGLEQDLMLRVAPRRARQWRVCVLIGADDCGGRPFEEVARSVLDAAPDCVQLREKHADARTLVARAAWLLEHAAPETDIVINDRPDVARIVGAAGVHLGQSDLACREARRIVGAEMLIGVSTSRLEEARQAYDDGADYCGIGPMFPTTTKQKDVIVGPAYLRAYVEWGRLPHLAIGGITPENVQALTDAGGQGIAVCRSVCAAPDPGAVVRALTDRLSARGVGTDQLIN